MCTLCIEIIKGKMTLKETVHALKEFVPNDPSHIEELMEKIGEKFGFEDVAIAIIDEQENK